MKKLSKFYLPILKRTVFILLLLFSFIPFAMGQTYVEAKDINSAIKFAQESNKFIFILVTDQKPDKNTVIEKNVKEYQKKNADGFILYNLNINNSAEKSFIDKYQLINAPTPLLLIMSPEEVITGGYPGNVSIEQLEQNMNLSSLILKIMKSMQERKIALVCFQNESTKYNKASDKAVMAFKNSPGYKEIVDIIKADPKDQDNLDFMKQAGVEKDIKDATVVFLMPPGRIINIYSGKITKADLEKSLASCTSGAGCCPPPGQ